LEKELTEFLLGGDSAFCICGHHVVNHHTRYRLITGGLGFWDIKLQEYYTCDNCSICNEFRPYNIDCQCISCKIARDYDQTNTKNEP
jgi:hypothetical protein